MSFIRQTEPRFKAPKIKPNEDYIAKLHQLPCCVCEAHGEQQLSPTEAHHPYHGRFSQIRTPDAMAVPLCDGHHQAKYDKSKLSVHDHKEEWAARYGEDSDYTAGTQDEMVRRWPKFAKYVSSARAK